VNEWNSTSCHSVCLHGASKGNFFFTVLPKCLQRKDGLMVVVVVVAEYDVTVSFYNRTHHFNLSTNECTYNFT